MADLDERTPPATGAARGQVGDWVGRYQIGKVIGAGGVGVVYAARDPELERDVAIKVVGVQGSEGKERALAEARAMAKVSHRAIVPVFDVGTVAEAIYIVMPMAGGGTLQEWMKAEKRAWNAVLAKFVAAGRGLEAAHEAGIVHRDFKATNVLLDGEQVMVADFGLAGAGTPKYMAPEQAANEAIDMRADQYSFCASLREGLKGAQAPAWLMDAVDRGTAEKREDRWPSMAALLDHLERRRARPKRIALAAGGLAVVGLAVGGVLMLGAGKSAAACPMPDARLTDVWDADVRSRVDAAFAAADAKKAATATAEAAKGLDAYAAAWRTMHVEACRATNVQRKQTPEVLDRRMACLDRRLAVMGTLTKTLADTRDAAMVGRAAKLVDGLPRIEDCADEKRLMAVVAPPTDPAARAAIAELQAELDAIQALKWRGEYAEQLRRAQAAVERARSLNDLPILARAMEMLVKAQGDNGKDDPEVTRELAKVAAAAGLDEISARAWLGLLNQLTSHQISHDEARTLEAAAHAAIVRAGSPPRLVFQEHFMGAARAANAGEYQLARERFQASLPLAGNPQTRVEVEANLAKLTYSIEGPSAALPLAEKSVKDYEEVFGKDHSIVADPLIFLAQVLHQMRDLDRSREMATRALEIQQRALAPDSFDTAMTLELLGTLEADVGKMDEGLAHLQEAAAIFEKGGDIQRHATTLDSMADIVRAREGMAKARPLHLQALAQFERAQGKDSVYYARMEINFAEALVESDACGEAEPLLQHAAEVFAKRMPSMGAIPHWLRAKCLLAANRVPKAIAELERGEALCRQGDCDMRDNIFSTLGFLLVDKNVDRKRGLSLVQEVRASYEARGLREKVTAIDAWLAKVQR